MTKYLEILLQVRFFKQGNKIYQHFIVVNNKQKKYLLNSRYTLSRKFEDIIEENALSLNNDNYIFSSRIDEDDRIVLEFDIIDNNKKDELKTFFANIAGVIPTTDCCDECAYFKTDGDSFFCEKKEKQLNRRVKNCKFFKQKK